MKLENKEILSLLEYRRFTCVGLFNLLQRPDFDLNKYELKTLIELRYVLLQNYLYIYKNYICLLQENTFIIKDITDEFYESDLILLNYSKK